VATIAAGHLAVITGGGTGMGRELARQLSAEGCHVAICDLDEEAMAETVALCQLDAPAGTRITATVADVSDEAQLVAFRTAVMAEHETDHLELLFNNAGIGGAGSFIVDEREAWERTFNICWGGVYLGCRVFMPMLLAAEQAHIVNTSSVNGFWATLGLETAHTAYSAAKFAVKGFSEALITDLRLNAPQIGVSVVMPGHIGTSIAINSGRIHGRDPKELTAEQIAEVRTQLERRGLDVSGASDEDIRLGIQAMAEAFRDAAPMSAAEAATVIIEGVRAGRWRILVGDDAHVLDEMVRADPENAYETSFHERLRERQLFGFGQG
jgi:NAD(P)-dependent dehydrogenase (short-subunit alcohol dehydrogenase family)